MCIALHTGGGTVRNNTDCVLRRQNKLDKKGLRKQMHLLRHKNEKKNHNSKVRTRENMVDHIRRK
jgi:hypothetical protein